MAECGGRSVIAHAALGFSDRDKLTGQHRQESGGWKVVDVLVDGAISRVAAQRSEMRSMLADSGGAGLLVGLRQKTADLSGGILQ